MVIVSVVDSFEFCSIYFAAVFDQRRIIPLLKRGYLISFFAWMPELGICISPFDFGLKQ